MAASSRYGPVLVRRGKSIQQEEKSHDTEMAMQQARKWIEVSEANLYQFANSVIIGMYEYITT